MATRLWTSDRNPRVRLSSDHQSMFTKVLEDRVRDAFPGGQPIEFGHLYLGQLMQSWRDIQAGSRRTATLICVLIIAFLGLPALMCLAERRSRGASRRFAR
jgi:hypothetical protein